MVRKVTNLIDQLMIYARDEPAFTRMANSFVEENPAGNRAEPAIYARDIPRILRNYCDLKQINFYTHGSAGQLHLYNGGIVKSVVSLFLEPPPKLFLDEGRVLFMGCNVGEGEEGRDFLIEAGKTLLRGHGGFVGGSTSSTFSIGGGLIDTRLPLWGNLRVIRLDSSGNVVVERLF
jgi:hypothetical protein